MLPNPYKSTEPDISQYELMQLYKQLVVEYIEKKDAQGKTLLDRCKGTPGFTLEKLYHYIWGGFCYMMGQKNFHFGHGPPPPSVPPEWLKEHLKPILMAWAAE